MVERGPEKAGVGGSIPSLATTLESIISRLPSQESLSKNFRLTIERLPFRLLSGAGCWKSDATLGPVENLRELPKETDGFVRGKIRYI